MPTSHRIREGLVLVGIAATASCASWLVMDRAPSATPQTLAPAHVTWWRYDDLRAIMKDTKMVVRAKVVNVRDYDPITADEAGAAKGAPEIPRQLITLTVTEQLYGPPPAQGTVDVVHARPPSGSAVDEDPDFKLGEAAVLFLRDAIGPKGVAEPGVLNVVGIDGRYRVEGDGRTRSALGGPIEKQALAAFQDPSLLAEAANPGRTP